MSARLTRGERKELAAVWPDFWNVHATVERILAARLAEAEQAAEQRLAEVAAERDEAVRQMVAQVIAARSRAEEADTELADLRAQVEALHRPIKVYDECEHDDNHGCEPVEVYDYKGCSESVIGWGCAVCCYDDEHPREDCPHGADHRGVTREQSCPTHALVAQQRDGGGSDD